MCENSALDSQMEKGVQKKKDSHLTAAHLPQNLRVWINPSVKKMKKKLKLNSTSAKVESMYPRLIDVYCLPHRTVCFSWSYLVLRLYRTRDTRPTSVCGTSCTQSSPVFLWRARKRESPASSTRTMPTCWRAPWMSTTARGTATWRRLEDCWTPRATASACHWVSGEWWVESWWGKTEC